ncbi:hypothetical protein FHS29_006002 [Saccharothrix tamanrassetensis]|uniref:Uncharacterized protein n=1 Tax=Saccharothrix tamanrassetensis TaxID=1051531 RepID=A0A841CNZ7_9PSEU|nr:hypothetical protein [Saccharothrix tamanrassetensis]MBB5959381.1 hypothetical protein [Saccharothrix tamanrassetensis]
MVFPARKAAASLIAAVALTVLVATPAKAATDAELAFHWAPIHYQDTDSSDYDADYLSTVDFDGEWNTLNNWESQDDSLSRLTGAAYYSVVETSTHWFITYSFYHPRDWEDFPDPFEQFTHENDMEGVLATVRRDGSAFGRLEAVVTVAHSDFYSYVPAGSTFTGGRENLDGTLPVQGGRPVTRQEAKGHGIYAWNGAEFPGGDGVVYVPSGTGEVPSGGNDRSVGYRLVDTFAAGGLWARRSDSTTFAGWGTLRGDNGKNNAANTAWGWDDGNDGSDLPRGLPATDPAHLVSVYFANRGEFSLTYTRNAYR